MSRKLTRIHPASVLAMLALFVALGGGAYAAAGKIGTSEIKNGAITKAKIKKNAVTAPKIKAGAISGAKLQDGAVSATKIQDGAVAAAELQDGAVATTKIQNGAVTGAKVNEASFGTVPDAAKLEGRGPAAFESKGFGGTDNGFQGLKTDAVTVVTQQPLPAGSYLVMARGGLNNNGSETVDGSSVSCSLSAGGTTREVTLGALAKNAQPGDREEFELMLLATLPSAGEAVLSCETNSNWDEGNVTDPTIVAVSLQP